MSKELKIIQDILTGRNPGDAPFSLLDYFNEPYKDKWMLLG